MNIDDILKVFFIATPIVLTVVVGTQKIVSVVRESRKEIAADVREVHTLVNSANEKLQERIEQLYGKAEDQFLLIEEQNKKIEAQAVEIKLLREREVK